MFILPSLETNYTRFLQLMLTLSPIKGFKGSYFLHNTFQVLAKITYWPKETPPKKEGQDRKKAEKGLGAERPHYSRMQDTEQV